MTTTKKQYQDLVNFLEQNKNKKVSTILDQVLEMTSTKVRECNHIKDDTGRVTHIFCYYHKKFEPLDTVEYGSKKNSTTGYNTMCKEGVRHWTRTNKLKKEVSSKILEMLQSGEITSEQVEETKSKMIEELEQIIPREDGQGTDEM